MIITKKINTQELEDPNAFGEDLRDFCFIKKRADDYGCYSTFDLIDDFKEAKEDFPEIVEGLIGKEKDYTDYDKSFWGVDYNYMYKLTEVFYNERLDIIVAWQWDSDGTLLIKENDKTAINKDCKCSNEWNWIEQ